MPLSKAGKKIKAKLEKQYGEKKGEGIFYAMENKGEIPGMNKKTGYNVGGQVPTQPSQVGAMQAQQAAFNRRQGSAMNTANAQSQKVNQFNLDQAKKMAGTKGPTQRPTSRPRAMNANQAGAMQAQQAAATRRRQAQTPNTPDTTTNQRNMALAQRNMAAKTQRTPAPKTPRRNMNPLFNRRLRGMAEGGMVKSTGKLDTGIRKCGE